MYTQALRSGSLRDSKLTQKGRFAAFVRSCLAFSHLVYLGLACVMYCLALRVLIPHQLRGITLNTMFFRYLDFLILIDLAKSTDHPLLI